MTWLAVNLKGRFSIQKLLMFQPVMFRVVGDASNMEVPCSFRIMLKRYGYSGKVIRELWKWYDYLEKKGVASF